MLENGGDLRFVYIEAQTLTKKRSHFNVIFITQLSHRHCLATIAFILDIYFRWNMDCDGPITNMWNLKLPSMISRTLPASENSFVK